jgi:hypothetical protein
VKRIAPILVFLIMAIATPSLPAAEEGDSTPALDPVVADVVRMLEENVEPGVVEAWLDSGDHRPGPLTADDMVALSRAGAPETLISRLLELSEAEKPAAVVAEEPIDSVMAGRTDFSVRYKPQAGAYDEDRDPWALYVYLDGWPLAWTDGGSSVFTVSTKPLRFHETLAPGKHVIRLLKESHVLVSKKNDRWAHEALVCPVAVEFAIEAGSSYRIDLELNENVAVWSKQDGPLSYSLFRNDALLAEEKGEGPDTDEWSALCEEVETAFPGEKRDSRAAARAMKGCVSWESLWPSTPDDPDRETVRQLLAEVDYRPLPATSE